MNPQEIGFLFWLPILLMPFMWFAVTRMFNSWLGLRTKLCESTGAFVSQTSWGTASINGYNASGCVRLLVYENGYALKIMPIFGGGLLWIPKDRYSVIGIRPKKYILQLRVDLDLNGKTIRLFGALAKPFA
jgi:hypothetical protein